MDGKAKLHACAPNGIGLVPLELTVSEKQTLISSVDAVQKQMCKHTCV